MKMINRSLRSVIKCFLKARSEGKDSDRKMCEMTAPSYVKWRNTKGHIGAIFLPELDPEEAQNPTDAHKCPQMPTEAQRGH